MKELKQVPTIDPTITSALIEKYPDYEENILNAVLYGPNARFRPAKTDHIHSLHKSRKMTLKEVLKFCTENKAYSQFKLECDFEYKGMRLFEIDVDDKGDGANGVAISSWNEFDEEMAQLPSTVVKSPTGEGFHALYWVSESHDLNSVPFDVGEYPGLEFTYCAKGTNQTFVLAGSYKKDGEQKYTLTRAVEPAVLSSKLTSICKTQTSFHNAESTRLSDERFIAYGGKLDTDHAKQDYLNMLMKTLADKPIDKGNRNQRWWWLILRGLEHVLSLDAVVNIIDTYAYQNPVFNKDQSKECAEEYIKAQRSAKIFYDNKEDKFSRAVIFDPWPEDLLGLFSITKEKLYERIHQINSHSPANIMRNRAVRAGFCTVVLHDATTNEYFVPASISSKDANNYYNKALQDANEVAILDFFGPIREFEKSGVHWQVYNSARFKDQYRYHDGKQKHPTVLALSEVFMNTHLSVRRVRRAVKLENHENIFVDGVFSIPINEVIEPLSDLEYEKIKHKVLDWEKRLLSDVVMNNEDYEFLINRFATNVQEPFKCIQNATTLYGPQNNGKSTLLYIFAHLFQEDLTANIQGNEQLFTRFTETNCVTICEEISPNNMKESDFHMWKSRISAPRTSIEKKGEQKYLLDHPSNYYSSTNERITKTEQISGRRHSVLQGNFNFDMGKRPEEIRNCLLEGMVDHYHILRGWKTRLLKKDVSKLNPYYKSEYQLGLQLEIAKGMPITSMLVGYILNEGYVNGVQLFKEGDYISVNDILVLAAHYDDPSLDLDLIVTEPGTRITSLMNDGPNTMKINKAKFKHYFPDPNEVNKTNVKIKSKFGRESNYGHIIPSMKDAIRCLTAFNMVNATVGTINYVVKMYHLESHWNGEVFEAPSRTIDHKDVVNYDDFIKELDY